MEFFSLVRFLTRAEIVSFPFFEGCVSLPHKWFEQLTVIITSFI